LPQLSPVHRCYGKVDPSRCRHVFGANISAQKLKIVGRYGGINSVNIRAGKKRRLQIHDGILLHLSGRA